LRLVLLLLELLAAVVAHQLHTGRLTWRGSKCNTSTSYSMLNSSNTPYSFACSPLLTCAVLLPDHPFVDPMYCGVLPLCRLLSAQRSTTTCSSLLSNEFIVSYSCDLALSGPCFLCALKSPPKTFIPSQSRVVKRGVDSSSVGRPHQYSYFSTLFSHPSCPLPAQPSLTIWLIDPLFLHVLL
jgi:hypothetical protein